MMKKIKELFQKKWIKIVALSLCAVLLLGAAGAGATFFVLRQPQTAAVGQETDPPVEDETPQTPVVTPVAARNIQKPQTLRGIWLTAGVDYLAGEDRSPQAVKAELDACFDQIKEYGIFNSLVVPVSVDGKLLFLHRDFPSVADEEFDPLSYICEKARQEKMYLYCVFDVFDASVAAGNGVVDPFSSGDIARSEQALRSLCDYNIDGILLSGYYYPAGAGKYLDYLQAGSAIGYQNYRSQCMAQGIRRLANALSEANPNLHKGLLADGIWANRSDHPLGSDTDAGFAAFTTAGADTLKWVRSGQFDFVMVKNYGSLNSETEKFDAVANWWAELVKGSKTGLYFSHAAFKVASEEEGWTSPDQLVRQAIFLGDIGDGNAFCTLRSLENDQYSTNALLGLYSGQLETKYIMNELEVTSPGNLTLTTYESKITFRGSSDPNFPFTLNDKEVDRTENGYFGMDMDLKTGSNRFTLVHKDKTLVYNITSAVVVVKEISPAGAVRVDGGTQLSIEAVARKGATLRATINGTTLSMAQGDITGVEEGAVFDSGSDFTKFHASYTLPGAGDTEKNIGAVTVSGTFKGITDVKSSGSIIINAGGRINIPPPPENIEDRENFDPVNWPDIPKRSGTIVQVSKTQAEVFDPGTVDDYSRADRNYLPKGTVDFMQGGEISFVSGGQQLKYRKMASGARLYVTDSRGTANTTTYTGELPTYNAIQVAATETTSRFYTLTFNTLFKAPFYLTVGPQSYTNPYPGGGGQPNYAISSFTATYVDIRFAYAAYRYGAVNIAADNPLFSSAEWRISGYENVLRLNLKKTGGFYGYNASYNGAGQLVFSFLRPVKTLSGARILLDPGHGGTDPGALGSLPQYHEKVLNLALATRIKNKLEAQGATVIMTRTGDTALSLEQRVQLVYQNKPDLMISVHTNASTSSSAYGYENYYFYPQSAGFSKAFFNNVAPAFGNAVYPSDSAKRSGSARGQFNYPYYVLRFSDCPSLLAEFGFVSNATEYQQLIKPEVQEQLATGAVSGIQSYLQNR